MTSKTTLNMNEIHTMSEDKLVHLMFKIKEGNGPESDLEMVKEQIRNRKESRIKYSSITKVLYGRAYVMIVAGTNEAHIAVKNDESRAFVEANRTIILKTSFEGRQPNNTWMIEKALEALQKRV